MQKNTQGNKKGRNCPLIQLIKSNKSLIEKLTTENPNAKVPVKTQIQVNNSDLIEIGEHKFLIMNYTS